VSDVSVHTTDPVSVKCQEVTIKVVVPYMYPPTHKHCLWADGRTDCAGAETETVCLSCHPPPPDHMRFTHTPL